MESHDWLIHWAISRPSFRSYYFSNHRLISRRFYDNIIRGRNALLIVLTIILWLGGYSFSYLLFPYANMFAIITICSLINIFISLFFCSASRRTIRYLC